MMGAWSSAIPGCIGQDDIGRESWVWDERETLIFKKNPPTNVGEEALTEKISLSVLYGMTLEW